MPMCRNETWRAPSTKYVHLKKNYCREYAAPRLRVCPQSSDLGGKVYFLLLFRISRNIPVQASFRRLSRVRRETFSRRPVASQRATEKIEGAVPKTSRDCSRGRRERLRTGPTVRLRKRTLSHDHSAPRGELDFAARTAATNYETDYTWRQASRARTSRAKAFGGTAKGDRGRKGLEPRSVLEGWEGGKVEGKGGG